MESLDKKSWKVQTKLRGQFLLKDRIRDQTKTEDKQTDMHLKRNRLNVGRIALGRLEVALINCNLLQSGGGGGG